MDKTIDVITVIGQGITFIGVLFMIYNSFKNPQIKSEKTDALLTQRFDLFQKDFNNLKDNHIHTIDVKLEENGKNITSLVVEVAKLSTIIEERIPHK
jgi:spore coat polysaccharide biosynthesis predicted glycosyltransferase SpsG